MIKLTIIACLLAGLNWQCKSQNNLPEKRNEVIRLAIDAIVKYDTIQLYKLIDTSAYFEIDDKEGLLLTISYLNKKFWECGHAIADSSIQIVQTPIPAKEYILPFCRNKPDGKFDLVVTFADYQNAEKIHFFDVKNYIDYNKLKPTKALSDSTNN